MTKDTQCEARCAVGTGGSFILIQCLAKPHGEKNHFIRAKNDSTKLIVWDGPINRMHHFGRAIKVDV
jgi:hypothetical protein